ncbi:RHS repeat protein [Parasphingopyxis algicola]|uniref:RHS repeat domain-containing protein n=1 Tax=Parasphingopyxis algicola TaxID=2026624 RepID=UPI0015A16A3B|nr:RHS repeat domain-containing protein [Parasphingopyxis algicola]QLC24475.1 RHS repeat protein [Parasphingopyxis algicola]
MLRQLIAIMVTIACSGLLLLKPAHGQQTCPEPSGAGSVEIYCYDALGRLIEQRRSDSASATIAYDDAGNRISRTETAGTAGLVVVIIGGRPFPIVIP